MTRDFFIPRYDIHIQVDPETPGSGTLVCSNLLEQLSDSADDDETIRATELLVDGMESLILAQACEGIDISTPAYEQALTTAIEAIAHHLS